MLRAAVVIAMAVGTAHAGPVYKCEVAPGKFDYRDTPCPDSKSKPLDLPSNSIDTAPSPAMAAIVEANREKMERQKRERAAGAKATAAADDAAYTYCQPFRDQIARSGVWIGSPVRVQREAAQMEIAIASRRLADAGCN